MADNLKYFEKNHPIELRPKEGAPTYPNLYVGVGWDNSTDMDLVAALLNKDGKLCRAGKVVHFGDRDEPGVHLSEDNQTGAGAGDDESLVIRFGAVEPPVMRIAIGVVAYRGGNLNVAGQLHCRFVNGLTTADPEIGRAKLELAEPKDTLLHAATLLRSSPGASTWSVEVVDKFQAAGNGPEVLKAWIALFS